MATAAKEVKTTAVKPAVKKAAVAAATKPVEAVKKPVAKKAAAAPVKKDVVKPAVAKKLSGAAAKATLKADLKKRVQALLDEANAAGLAITVIAKASAPG